ncbi:MAG: Xaa-Pro peptidase family protein [Candidatus Omnitrophota bacterium]|nr:Xaa-Pro peptidase family protein [Candidatus Omnitrophota bacterium]
MMPVIDYSGRIPSLRKGLVKRGLDAFLVTNETNISYLCGFPGKDSVLLLTAKEKYFITDSRFIEEAQENVKDFNIKLVRASTYETLCALIKKSALKKIGFEAMNLPYEVACRLGKLAGRQKLQPTKDFIEDLRSVKDPAEGELIRRSIRLTKKVLAITIERAKPGVAENVLSRDIELLFIKNGARAAFEPIVASGANSSKPHARPGNTGIANNSFLMIDIGCSLNSYNSDLTRMVTLGRVSDRFKKIYDIVRKAQRLAIEKIKPGVRISDVDSAARRYIQSRGFGKYFGHALGHGVGMDIHERPNISKCSNGFLRPGMIFTVEPAIYLPKFGGVRIEDMVLVTNSGCEILTA